MGGLSQPQAEALEVQQLVRATSNDALRVGAIYAAALGAIAITVTGTLTVLGFAGMELAFVFTLVGTALFALIHRLASRGLIYGRTRIVVGASIVILPTFFFIAAELLRPAGAATYLLGPMSYLYFFCVIITGLLLSSRLVLICTGIAVVQYLLLHIAAIDVLEQIRAPDPMLQQSLTRFWIHLLRVFQLAFAGAAVAALTFVAKRMLLRSIRHSQENVRVQRLFGQYVSPAVKDRLINDPDAHHGVKTRVVVLFSDIRGFTRYSESAAPEVLVTRLNTYFDAMVQAIQTNGGVIDKFVGDAIMAVFGGVVPLDDPESAAVCAARDMIRQLESLNLKWQAEGLSAFRIGIGLHGGEVIQGAIGSELRRDYTVIGDTVNTASRVEGLTKEHDHPILISAAVHAGLTAELGALAVPVGTTTIRGRTETIDLFGVPAR